MKTYNGVKEGHFQSNVLAKRQDRDIEEIVEEPVRRAQTYQVIDAHNIDAI